MRITIGIIGVVLVIISAIALLNINNKPSLPTLVPTVSPAQTSTLPTQPALMLRLSSPNFTNNAKLPKQFTCDGAGVNPAMAISSVPAEAKSLAMTLTDPDAPGGLFTHWLIWNIDPAATRIERGSVPAGATQGVNDFGKIGYGSPCPPSGSHRYIFTLYALDSKLDLNSGADLKQFLAAITGRIISSAVLTALYR